MVEVLESMRRGGRSCSQEDVWRVWMEESGRAFKAS